MEYSGCVDCFVYKRYKPTKKCYIAGTSLYIFFNSQQFIFAEKELVKNDTLYIRDTFTDPYQCQCSHWIKRSAVDIRSKIRRDAITRFIKDEIWIKEYYGYSTLQVEVDEDKLWKFATVIKINLRNKHARIILKQYANYDISLNKLIEELMPDLIAEEIKS